MLRDFWRMLWMPTSTIRKVVQDIVKAYQAISEAAQVVVEKKGIIGRLQEPIAVKGITAIVRGNVIDGQAKIGTAFIP